MSVIGEFIKQLFIFVVLTIVFSIAGMYLGYFVGMATWLAVNPIIPIAGEPFACIFAWLGLVFINVVILIGHIKNEFKPGIDLSEVEPLSIEELEEIFEKYDIDVEEITTESDDDSGIIDKKEKGDR